MLINPQKDQTTQIDNLQKITRTVITNIEEIQDKILEIKGLMKFNNEFMEFYKINIKNIEIFDLTQIKKIDGVDDIIKISAWLKNSSIDRVKIFIKKMIQNFSNNKFITMLFEREMDSMKNKLDNSRY